MPNRLNKMSKHDKKLQQLMDEEKARKEKEKSTLKKKKFSEQSINKTTMTTKGEETVGLTSKQDSDKKKDGGLKGGELMQLSDVKDAKLSMLDVNGQLTGKNSDIPN